MFVVSSIPREQDLDSSSEAEDNEDNSMENMEDLLGSIEPMKTLRRGDVVRGIVMGVDSEGILVHIGNKAEGLVPSREMRTLSPEAISSLNVGDEITTHVVRPESAERAAVLSVDRAVGETGWADIEKGFQSAETFEGKIIAFNRGGAIVEVCQVQGFVPMSQLVSVDREIFRSMQGEADSSTPSGVISDHDDALSGATNEDSSPSSRTDDEIGKVLQLKVLEVNKSRNRAIFSERQAVQEFRNAQRALLIEELQEGDVRRGKVTGISSFGAFVDLGGADGLVHISEMSWGPVNSPEDVVSVGSDVEVYILRVDREGSKIALSFKRLQPEPWATIGENFVVGDIVDGTVTKLTEFGAFARVVGDVEGLIHISELASRSIQHPREVVAEGDIVRLKVLRIEPERRRLGLSLKQAQEEELY